MAIDPDRPMQQQNRTDDRSRSSVGNILLILAAIVAIGVAIAFMSGMLNMSTSGNLEAPKVNVSGGEVPEIDVDSADVSIDTKSVIVEVPEITVEKPVSDSSNSNNNK